MLLRPRSCLYHDGEARRRLSVQATEHRRAAAQHAGQVAGLERPLKAAEADGTALAAAEARLSEFESGDTHRALERANAALAADLEHARQTGERAQARCDSLERTSIGTRESPSVSLLRDAG